MNNYAEEYITKATAQEVVKDVFRIDTITQEVIDTCIKCMIAIKNAPSANVRENANGNWIKRIDHLDYGLIEFEGFECSLCGVKIWKDDYENVEFKFCPNCGAQMRDEV